jgi:hypothetical protein
MFSEHTSPDMKLLRGGFELEIRRKDVEETSSRRSPFQEIYRRLKKKVVSLIRDVER